MARMRATGLPRLVKVRLYLDFDAEMPILPPNWCRWATDTHYPTGVNIAPYTADDPIAQDWYHYCRVLCLALEWTTQWRLKRW